MTEIAHCRTCGAELVAGASPEGLCPRCLLQAGLSDSRPPDLSALETAPSPPGTAGETIEVARLSRLFPHLEIQRLLGRGGMGAVYLARQKVRLRCRRGPLLLPDGIR